MARPICLYSWEFELRNSEKIKKQWQKVRRRGHEDCNSEVKTAERSP